MEYNAPSFLLENGDHAPQNFLAGPKARALCWRLQVAWFTRLSRLPSFFPSSFLEEDSSSSYLKATFQILWHLLSTDTAGDEGIRFYPSLSPRSYGLWSLVRGSRWYRLTLGGEGKQGDEGSFFLAKPLPSLLLQFVHAFRLHTKRSLWLRHAWQTGKSRDGRGKLHDESPSVCTLFLSVALLLVLTSCFCCDSCWNRSMMMCINPSDGLLLNKNSQGWQQSVDGNDTMELIAMCYCYYCYLGHNKVWIYGS